MHIVKKKTQGWLYKDFGLQKYLSSDKECQYNKPASQKAELVIVNAFLNPQQYAVYKSIQKS